MIRLVLFDIDGTLIHTGKAGMKAFAKVFATEFNIPNGAERIKFHGRTDKSLVREFFTLNNIPATPENFERFFERYVFWLDHIIPHSPTSECPGIRQLIRDIQGLPQSPLLGLLTGNILLGAEIKLRHFNLWHEFEVGGFADDHEDRDQIAHAAKRRGSRALGEDLSGDEIVVIGDTEFDIKCGRAIGARVLAVATGGQQWHQLEPHRPDWLVKDLTEITAKNLCG